ncbi:DUF4258 domain-containing protein [Aquimarina spongiae]|uniref:DUF4258 domain-containing protein n=1 Tax=Aquimarina spongiae TaxID=570521 RepID=A0A1M6ANH8_9FLAO|nr:DUF4258 domain-containing protein [Aquimarina spongiae]SHI38064.1 protein of unknown function [Aquimarina spongiae]
MKLAQRLFYYLGGFTIGLILLFFFLGGKKTSCDYGPNARVLKNIRVKDRVFKQEVLTKMQANSIDTADISKVLQTGSVDFSKSDTKRDSCNLYFIEGQLEQKIIELQVKNCDSTAKVEALDIKSELD